MIEPMTEDLTDDQGDAMYVLDRGCDANLKELLELAKYYDGRQFDYCPFDWFHQPRGESGAISYLMERQRYQGRSIAGTKTQDQPAALRRPCAQAGVAAQINQAFTDQVIPEMPEVRVMGDKEASACLAALLEAASAGAKFAELRDLGGRTKAAAMVVEVIGGAPTLTAYANTDIYVMEWEDRRRWIPADVVYQRPICVDRMQRGKVTTERMIATTRWTRTHTVVYEDVPESWDREQPIPERERIEHGAGRCPVVWYQNIAASDQPEGQHDLETDINLELSDQADRLLSSLIVATRSNTEPTMWKADTTTGQMVLPRVVAKGTGRLISLTEKGSVGFLEISGKTIEISWSTFDRIVARIMGNARCVLPDERYQGKMTATEVERRWSSMDKKVRKIREALEGAIVQVCVIFLAIARRIGVTTPEDTEERRAAMMVLPPIVDEIETEDETGEEVEGYVLRPYSPGGGSSIAVRWQSSRSVAASELPGVLSALSAAAHGAQVLSQKTAVAEAVAAIGRNNAEEEIREIEEEQEEREEKAAEAFMPRSGQSAAEDAAAAAEDLGDEGGSDQADLEVQEEGMDDDAGEQPPQDQE